MLTVTGVNRNGRRQNELVCSVGRRSRFGCVVYAWGYPMSNYAPKHEPWHDNLPAVCDCAPAWSARGLVDHLCWFHAMVAVLGGLPAGLVDDDGVFYPLMTDCPDSQIGDTGCETCGDEHQVWNPELWWTGWCDEHYSSWSSLGASCDRSMAARLAGGAVAPRCPAYRFAALGVKKSTS